METSTIGAAGELLVQYKLLKHSIDSARLTVDAGIDLVMCLPGIARAYTIQVKTKRRPVPAGGTGKPSLGWYFPDSCPAEYLACVDLSTDSAWLFTIDEARKLAQQHNDKGQRQIYWYTEEPAPKAARVQREMQEFQIDVVAQRLLADGRTEIVQ